MDPKQTTLVILPGWGGTKESWSNFVTLASRTFADVQVIELPCFGEQPCPQDVWGVEEYAGFVGEKIDAIAEPKIILGHSFGGSVATVALADGHAHADGLLLSGAALVRPRHLFRRTVLFIPAKIVKLLMHLPLPGAKQVRRVLRRLTGTQDYEKTSGQGREIFKKVIRQDRAEKLGEVPCKVALVWGSRDKHTPLAHGKQLAERFSLPITIVSEATHGLHIKWQGDLLGAAVALTQDI